MRIFEIWGAIESGRRMDFSIAECRLIPLFAMSEGRMTLDDIAGALPDFSKSALKKGIDDLMGKFIVKRQRRDEKTNQYIKPLYYLNV